MKPVLLLALAFTLAVPFPALARAQEEPVLMPGGSYTPVISPEDIFEEDLAGEEEIQDAAKALMGAGALSAPTGDSYLAPDPQIDADEMKAFPDPNADPVTVSIEPFMAQIAPTGRGATLTYDTSWAGWAGGGFTFDARGPIDMTEFGNLEFGLKGDITSLKLELVDMNEGKDSIHLSGIRNDIEQFWSVDTAYFEDVDLSQVRLIYFIVEGPDKTGQLEINIRSRETLDGPRAPDPLLSSGNLTLLPESYSEAGTFLPQPATVSPWGGYTGYRKTVNGVLFDYETGEEGWTGGGLTFDDFATGTSETADFSTLANFIFGLRSDAERIKVEFVDEADNKVSAYLTGIRSDEVQYWRLPLEAFDGVDLSHVKLIYFVVEGAYLSGEMELIYRTAHDGVPPVLEPSADLNPTVLTDLADPQSRMAGVIAAPGASADVRIVQRGIKITYNTGTAGWVGGSISFDYFPTEAVETFDLSGYEAFIFGLYGDAGRVKLEFVDDQERKQAVYLDGIVQNEEKVWRIDRSLLSQVDLSRTRMLIVIVEGPEVTGSLTFNFEPISTAMWTPAPSDANFGFRVIENAGGPTGTIDTLEVIDFRTSKVQMLYNRPDTAYEAMDVLAGRYAVFRIVGETDTHVFGLDAPLEGVLTVAPSNPDFAFIEVSTYINSYWRQETLSVINLQTGQERVFVNASRSNGQRRFYGSVHDVAPDGSWVVYESGGGQIGQRHSFPVVVQSLMDPDRSLMLTHLAYDFTLRWIRFSGGSLLLEVVDEASVPIYYVVDLNTLTYTRF